MKLSLDEIKAKLEATLSEKRYHHSLRTADCARELAERFGVHGDKAFLAGLLHDCAKHLSDEETLALARQSGIPVTEVEEARPVTMLHAALSAVAARRDYGVEDGEILQAIARHQSGGIPMTRLDKITGLADSIEPGRSGDYVDALRAVAARDLDEAYLQKHILFMIRPLRSRYLLNPGKLETYNALLLEQERKRKAEKEEQP